MARNDVSIWVRVKDGFSLGIKSAGAKLQKLAMDSRTYAAAVGAITAAMISAAREYSRFNKEMARSEALMGGQKHDQFRKQILALSDELGIAAAELSGGLYEALSKGVPRDNVISFLRTAGRTAIADGSSVKDSVIGIANVMNAFGRDVSEAEKIADLMFVAVRDGSTTIDQLSSSLSKVSSIASASGVEFTEVFAAIVALTQGGESTAEAVTKIKAAMLATNKVLGDGWAETMTLQDAFSLMLEKAKGSQNELGKLTGSSEALSAILGLTGRNAGRASKALAAMSGDLGLIDAAMAGTSGDAKIWDSLFNSLNNTIILFGDDITNRVTPTVNQLTEAIRDFNKVQSETPDKTREMLTELAKIPLLGFAQLPRALAATGTMLNDAIRGDNGGEAEKPINTPSAGGDAGPTGGGGEVAQIVDNAEAKEDANHDMLKAQAEFLKSIEIARQKAHDEEVDDFLEAEEEKTRILKDQIAERDQAMREERAEFLAGIAEVKEKQADARLFKNLDPTFSQRFEQFKQDRDARKDAEKEDAKIGKRLDRIAAKEGRGIKISRQDREFREDIRDFKAREAKADKLLAEAAKIQREIKLLLEQNLNASGGPA